MDHQNLTQSLFGVRRALIGMLHLGALPGSPGHREAVAALAARAVEEARLYRDAGFHALVIENMHDRPYLKGSVGPETVSSMAVIGHEVRRAVPLPLGVQVLAGANREAMAVALACGACFVRAVAAAVGVPTFVGSGVTPENLERYPHADGFIVGSSVKRAGHWANALDAASMKSLADAFAALG